jgi:hypothetical protein
MLRKALFSEAVPFVVTLFVGALGWFVTRNVDRLNAAPIVEYELSVAKGHGGVLTVRVDLVNLTPATAFENLQFVLRAYENNSKFTDARKQASPPAWEGNLEAKAAGQSATFTLAHFQPGWQIELAADCVHCRVVTFHLMSSMGPVRLLKPCLETFFLRHETLVLGGLLLVWASALLLLVRLRLKSDASDHS